MMTPSRRAATITGMPARSPRTIEIRPGKHPSPAHGACVVELASILAGEPFSDRPASVCPVIAGFLRGYNDLMPEHGRDELYAYAALVVDTATSRSIRRHRAHRILEWARSPPRLGRRSFYIRVRTWDLILLRAAEAALRMDPERRRVLVAELLDELVAIGDVAQEVGPARARPRTRARLVPAR
jgi:hypothetical protein